MHRFIFIVVMVLVWARFSLAQPLATEALSFRHTWDQSSPSIQTDAAPSIGAQVFIEPGQTSAEIENWFRILGENRFTSCRIRMFESYMKNEKGDWDFDLFDQAFMAADKYKIDVFATLFPDTNFNDIGGVKLPHDSSHLAAIGNYIDAVTQHFKKYKCLTNWVLINEPGVGYVPDTPFTQRMLTAWKDSMQVASNPSSRRQFDFTDRKFLQDYNTWFLKWIHNRILQNDPYTHHHVNNHSIFLLADEYDFPSWRPFLGSLGASIHPSWHFRNFSRREYTLAVSINNDMIRSGAPSGNFWVTELQGGNNTFSGYDPFCPTRSEIEQWLWTSIASGAKGIIFWSLNARSVGLESGEWALLNYQNGNTDRMQAAARVAKILHSNKTLFSSASPLPSDVTILYTHESIWAEKALHIAHSNMDARNYGAVFKSCFGYYEALQQAGITPDFEEIGEWNPDEINTGKTVILANQLAVSRFDWDRLQDFVKRGGTLLISGQSAMYDENLTHRFMTDKDYVDFLGGELIEMRTRQDSFSIVGSTYALPAHLWEGELSSAKGRVLFSDQSKTLGISHSAGKGRVLWIPSLVGLGAWKFGSQNLTIFLKGEIDLEDASPVKVDGYYEGLVARSMESMKGNFITLLINKSTQTHDVQLDRDKDWKPTVLVGDGFAGKETKVAIAPEETILIAWQKQ